MRLVPVWITWSQRKLACECIPNHTHLLREVAVVEVLYELRQVDIVHAAVSEEAGHWQQRVGSGAVGDTLRVWRCWNVYIIRKTNLMPKKDVLQVMATPSYGALFKEI